MTEIPLARVESVVQGELVPPKNISTGDAYSYDEN